jgi:hypothetical protein
MIDWTVIGWTTVFGIALSGVIIGFYYWRMKFRVRKLKKEWNKHIGG